MNLIPFATSLLRGHWKLFLLGALLTIISIQQLRVTGLKSSLSAEKAARAADRSSYERAQAEATSNALQAKIATEKKYADNADTAQAGYDALRARYDGLLRAKAAQGAGSGPVATAQGDDPGVHEAAAAVPIAVFALSESDWLKLPALQAYADQCYSFGQGL